MKTTHAVLAVATGGFLGLMAGKIAVSSNSTAASTLAVMSRWLNTTSTGPSRTEVLEKRVKELQERTAAMDALETRLEELEKRLDGIDGAHAFSEARQLGIIDAVSESRPDLRPSAVRRVGVALVSEARRNDLDPLLLAALARVESGYNPFATSDAGARGLLQLTPPTGRTMANAKGSTLNHSAELYDIETNIALGAHYLADLVRQFDTVDAALLAYNRGIGGAKAALRSPNRERALEGYPKTVLTERARLAERAAHRDGKLPL